MKLKEILSPTTLRLFFCRLLKAHPFTFGWIVAIAVWGLLYINDVVEISSVIAFCLAEGFFMSLAIDIWTDFLDKRRFYVILEIIAILLVGTDCFITSCVGGIYVDSNFVGHASLLTGLIVACFFVPLSSSLTNRTQTYSQLIHTAMSITLAVVFLMASVLFINLLRELFNILITKFDDSLLFICAVVLPLVVFTGLQLTKAKAKLSAPVFFGGGFCKFVLLPIVLIYFAVLYVYLFKILITWELPNGEVTRMVTIQIVLVLVVLFGLRDYFHNSSTAESNVTIFRLAMRWLPLLMIPMLVLMTVAIFYRLNQYGITADRIYVTCFLLWAYCVDFYLILKFQNSNLNLVAISFAVGFVAISAIPGCNVISITNAVLRAEIMKAFSGHQLPLTLKEARKALSLMPADQKSRIASKIVYLDSWDDHSQISDIVSHNERIRERELVDKELVYYESRHNTKVYHRNDSLKVPVGFSMFKESHISSVDYDIDREALLQAALEDNPPQINCYSKDSSTVAVITYASFTRNDSTIIEITDLNAIVFYNK